MRVWDIHPGYLSDKSLLGEHVEIHALYSIITGNKKGYSKHPETKRWKGHLQQLISRHNLVVKEMLLREFKHNSPILISGDVGGRKSTDKISYINVPNEQFIILDRKYSEKGQKGRIPLPKNGTELWAHHKYSVMARNYQYYKDIKSFMKDKEDFSIEQETLLFFKIQIYMNFEISESALENTVQHLWGYFKKDANSEEKEYFFNLLNSITKLNLLFTLAKKYHKTYLLHSTIFADL
jgi:uncharacterized protein YbgA (DUF1722 family)